MTSPAFFDLQVNGYGGVDFNQDDLTPDALHRACERLEADGVAGILATVITDHLDRMSRRLSNLVRLREADPLAKRLIVGLHIEGPFISPVQGYRGAHPADAVRPADRDEMQLLLDAGGGLTKLVTLAPEQDAGAKVTRLLASQGVRVSAGHTDASLDQLSAALDAGLTLFTHLGNGCPMQMHRHDNIVQRALSLAGRLQIMFIADGTHVPYTALRNYLRLTGIDTTIVVSDAIAPAGLGPGRYTLGRWDLLIGDDMVARAPDGSHFVGSAITMKQAYANLIGPVGLSNTDATKLTRDNPMRAVGIESTTLSS
ncbi:MAG: N-acetylglucosamine-6-phosphate deacetylase [Planctomycetota bacterium]|nr:N-acetylglucosamine-6-phosphate deacetylase [Planctomycetota bacterium]